jgi:predicted MFS family arabinose efflux permease
MHSPNQPATRLAVRLAFLVAGFGLACWAPLVPFAKQQLAVDDGVLGVLLLCLGVGSIIAMLLSGIISARYGSKPIVIAGGIGLALALPLLTLATTPFALGAVLFVFGASLGAVDVAINVQALEVEGAANRPLMSGFHALFSVGGFLGAGAVTFFLSIGLSALVACLICSAFMLIAMILAAPGLLPSRSNHDGPFFVLPKGLVLLLAVLTAITFLVEGAILDWSALLITSQGHVSETQGGLGYMLFAIAMTIGRFAGDGITTRFGDKAIMLWGGLITIFGFLVLLLIPHGYISLSGFFLIGLGASNLVPVLFRRAGSQKIMPPALAVAAVAMLGYAGMLVGPAGVGFVADLFGLPASFWMLALLMCLIPVTAKAVTRPD